MVTLLEITLNEVIEGPCENKFYCYCMWKTPNDWRLENFLLHKCLYPNPHPTAIPSHPLLHMTLAPNSSFSPLTIKSRLPKQWLLFRKNNPSILISATSWTSTNPHPAKSSWTLANPLLLKPCKIFHCLPPS